MPRVGRPSRLDKNTITEILSKYKDEIIKEDGRIISKSDPVWIRIGIELNNVMTPIALYTYVTCNKFKIRDKLLDRFQDSVHENDTRGYEDTDI